jgi:nitroimidazol reductase NimA-like FMN-containing flavoprotein (pyridoxamine 5'-phosphate oxidase superfamily)
MSKQKFMLGTLQHEQIEEVLKNQFVGHIGCSLNNETYIVPISYVYDGNYIYCHTTEGKKTGIMRKNPKVCFQVDDMRDMANWRSVVVEGEFEEIKEPGERNKAMQILLNRYLPVISSVTTHLGEIWPFHADDVTNINGIVFRIAAKKKTGRFENSIQSPDLPY